ncbi:MAG TPA: type II secretion system F family protein [Mycobacterium sp.]|nr:type II secretion system F family protein [Mycobacterium sp.]
MTGPAASAVVLALALAVLPSAPRRRLAPAGAARRAVPRIVAGWTVGCAAVPIALFVPPATDLALVIVTATVALRYHRRNRRLRSAAETQSLQAAMDVLVGELRVGAHPVRAFSVAAAETDGTVAAAFRAVAARARLGADVAAGLRSAGGFSALPAQWNRLAVCWQLAAQHGLGMSVLMRAAQRDIVARQRFSMRVSAKLAGARTTATVLAALPVLGVLLGQLIGAQPLKFLLGNHTGGWLLVIGTTLACGGLLWADRITDRVVT